MEKNEEKYDILRGELRYNARKKSSISKFCQSFFILTFNAVNLFPSHLTALNKKLGFSRLEVNWMCFLSSIARSCQIFSLKNDFVRLDFLVILTKK